MGQKMEAMWGVMLFKRDVTELILSAAEPAYRFLINPG